MVTKTGSRWKQLYSICKGKKKKKKREKGHVRNENCAVTSAVMSFSSLFWFCRHNSARLVHYHSHQHCLICSIKLIVCYQPSAKQQADKFINLLMNTVELLDLNKVRRMEKTGSVKANFAAVCWTCKSQFIKCLHCV